MPKLIIFAPCDKVIVGMQDNTTSLISLIEAFTIDIPEDAKLPEETTIPIKWHILAIWEKVEGEEGKNFEQRIELQLPNGGYTLDASSTIDFEPEPRRFRMVTTVVGFPMSPKGECLLRLSVREVGQEAWQEVADYGILVNRPASAPQNTETASEEPRAEINEAR